jgi:protein arginine kinase activator
MKCDQCGQEATVHELRVVNGKKVERHLCEACARKQGIAVQPVLSVPELLEKYIQQAAATSKPAATGAPARSNVCPSCGTTYMEFRQTGLLGCPDCYRAFEAQLGPLLERAHEGGAHHVGKLPRRLQTGETKVDSPASGRPVPARRQGQELPQRISSLRKQLEDAVKAEQYERAATIRDELRKLTELHAKTEGESR